MNMKSYFKGENANNTPVVINQTAKEILQDVNIGDPIYMGNSLGRAKVIGIIEDFHFMPLDQKIDPVVLFFHPGKLPGVLCAY